MKKLLVFSLWLLGASSLFAQSKQDTLFYDKNWKGVESKSFASYYRILSGNANSNYGKRFRDYYVTGELQAEGSYISIDKYDDSKSVMDGECTTYYKSGQIEVKRNMRNGSLEGEYTIYYENGLIGSHCMMKMVKSMVFLQNLTKRGIYVYKLKC